MPPLTSSISDLISKKKKTNVPGTHNSVQYTPNVSPTSLIVTVTLSTGTLITLGTLSMISISSHREKFPVTSLSTVGPKSFCFGHRMIAGTLVFSIFNHSAFTQATGIAASPVGYGSASSKSTGKNPTLNFWDSPADELPPMDIHLIYDNTVKGEVYYEGLRGVVILDEGSVRSIDNPAIQESYSFMARDRIPLQPLENFLNGNNSPAYLAALLGKPVQSKAPSSPVSVILSGSPAPIPTATPVPRALSSTQDPTANGVLNNEQLV